MTLKGENGFLMKGIHTFALMCPQDHHDREWTCGSNRVPKTLRTLGK